MNIIPVRNRKTRKQFLDVARIIYRNDPVWVCPFDNEIEAIFNPEKNPYHKHGEAERWILLDGNNNLIGRIAAFIDRNLAYSYDQPT
ncbi:MAG: GNAT family N-acetyltransferase, partial [Bacteroidia bacterium]|nr:GNAT family N-acetyltransferase [Bacteroidia bacterium]